MERKVINDKRGGEKHIKPRRKRKSEERQSIYNEKRGGKESTEIKCKRRRKAARRDRVRVPPSMHSFTLGKK